MDNVSPEFVCETCGNEHNGYQQYNIGTYLVHKPISYHEENEPDEVIES